MRESDELTFLGSRVCPYCQRVELALLDAGYTFKRDEVELGRPSPSQRALSPFGRFPILSAGKETIFESGAILEWINEHAGGAYLPASVQERARIRGLCLAIDALHAALRAFFTAPEPRTLESAYAATCKQLLCLERLSGPWSGPGGPHMQPYLSAFYLAPLLILCSVLDTAEYPLLGATPRLAATGRQLVRERTSFELLSARRSETASFFLGVEGALSPFVEAQLEELASRARDSRALTRSARRYMAPSSTR